MAETSFECPHCGRVDSSSRAVPTGATVRCPGCRESFRVKSAATAPRSARSPGRRATLPDPLVPVVDPFADLELERPAPPPVEPVITDPSAAPVGSQRQRRRQGGQLGTIDRDGWMALAIGLALALVVLVVPFGGFVVQILMVVIHELGHSATGWLFASPALPSFDLTYGGGVSLILNRQPVLIAVAYAIFASMLWRARADFRKQAGWLIIIGLYSLALFTPLRSFLITAMGHGSELLFAGIFLGRALSGNQILRSEERPLYAAVACFILITDARFAIDLMASADARADYGDAKGGGHTMDFDVIARDYLHCRIQTVAFLFLTACVLTPLITIGWRRYARRLIRMTEGKFR